MAEIITLNTGLKTYDIVDADGTPVCSIRFNPGDLGLLPRLQEAKNLAEGYLKSPPASLPDLLDADRRIKEALDYAFGGEVGSRIFAGQSVYAVCDDGELLLSHIFSALLPIVEQAQSEALTASQKKVAKYTAKYGAPAQASSQAPV